MSKTGKVLIILPFVLLLVALAVSAGIWLSLTGEAQAAVTYYSLNLGQDTSALCTYGDAPFDADDNGRVWGSISDSTFYKGVGHDAYFDVRDLLVSTDFTNKTDPQPLCQGQGLVDKAARKYVLVVDYDHTVPVYDGNGATLGEIYFVGITEKFQISVIKRTVTVTLDIANSHIYGDESTRPTVVEENGITYIEHQYGTPADIISFGLAAGSNTVFGDVFQVGSSLVGNGQNVDWHAGDYTVTQADLGLTIINAAGQDATDNYEITTDKAFVDGGVDYTGYAVRVTPHVITLDGVQQTAPYTAASGTAEQTAQLFHVDRVGCFGETIAFWYDVDGTNPAVFEYPDRYVVDLTATGHPIVHKQTVVTLADGSMSTYTDYVLRENPTGTFCLIVTPRPITIYDPDTYQGGDLDPKWSVPIRAEDFEAAYGFVYPQEGITDRQIAVAGSTATLRFKVKDADRYLDGNAQVVLPAARYEIVDAAVDDRHYSVYVDPGIAFVVRPKTLTYETLAAWTADGSSTLYADLYAATQDDKFVSYCEGNGVAQAFCLPALPYAAVDCVQTQLALTDPDIGALTLNPTVTATDPYPSVMPGFYAVTDTGNGNYVVADNCLYVYVLPVELQIDASSVVYNGTPQGVRIRYDGFDSDPFEGLPDVDTVTVTYGSSTAIPTKAGQYNVTVSVSRPSQYPYRHCYTLSVTKYQFAITPRAVQIAMTVAAGTKPFGTTLQAAALGTVQVWLYDEDGRLTDRDGLVEGDTVRVTCQATESSAVPGAYSIRFDIVDRDGKSNLANYRVDSQVDQNGKTPQYTVDNLAQDKAVQALTAKVTSKGIDTLTLQAPAVGGVTLTDVVVCYRPSGSDEAWKTSSSLTLNGLEEGAEYSIKLTLPAGNHYLAGGKAAEGAEIVAVTAVELPLVSQDKEATTASRIAVMIDNYNADYSYTCTVDDGEDDTVSPDENGRFWLPASVSITPDTEYVIVVTRHTTAGYKSSKPLSVYSRMAAPAVTVDSLTITPYAITVPDALTGYVFASPLTEVDFVSLFGQNLRFEQTGLTAEQWQQALDAMQDPDFIAPELTPDTAYIVAVWSSADYSIGDMPGEATFILCRTSAAEALPQPEGFALIVSKYLLVGMTALFVVLLTVCAIRYVAIKKKLTGGTL